MPGTESIRLRPYELLEHRQPFVFLDAVEIVDPGKKGRGRRLITINDPAVGPDGILPNVFIVEAMAQLSGITASAVNTGGEAPDVDADQDRGVLRGALSAIKDMKFVAPVYSGQNLELASSLEGAYGGLYVFHCEAYVEGNKAAEGRVFLELRP